MLTRNGMIQRLIAVARTDPRIVGLFDYGSSNAGRADEWSDVDAAVFIRDEDLDAFSKNWASWAAQFGPLLLAYVYLPGHPWAVYDAIPIPLRVDFALVAESRMAEMLDWTTAPVSIESAVLFDGTGGKLIEYARQLVGKFSGPSDLHETFEKVCGDFWYYALRTFARTPRGHLWAARFDYNFMILGNLSALLRLEAGAVDRWRNSSAAIDIEHALSPERMQQLTACIPGPDTAGLQVAFRNAIELGYTVCENVANMHNWEWPQQLAVRVRGIYANQPFDRAAGIGK